RYVYAYDDNGNQIEVMHFNWDAVNNNWLRNMYYVDTYDVHGNRVKFTSYSWSAETSTWIDNLQVSELYDEKWQSS
ncbi:unnamed protein product, partial [marine sediment metagenome]